MFLSVIFCASKADVLVFVVSNIFVFGLIFLIFFINERVARYSPMLDALIQINLPFSLFLDEKANLSLILEYISLLCKILKITTIITMGKKIIEKILYIRSKSAPYHWQSHHRRSSRCF